MKKLVTLFLIVFPVSLFAQIDPVGAFNRYVVENWSGQFQRIGNYKVKGSPFLLGGAMPGEIKHQGGVMVKNQKILYNLHEQIVGPDMNGAVFQADQVIEEFVLYFPAEYSGEKAHFVNASRYEAPKGTAAYVQVMSEGKAVSLLKGYRIKIVPDPTNMMDKEFRLFEQYTEYYLFDAASKTFTKVKISKKDFATALKATPALQDKVKSYSGNVETMQDARVLVDMLNL
ncbi:MAG TPA: hypothetical protein VLC98_03365 [Phnomibacter sp.]|nr:hypothetical protein [Phnomibacter sp.]